MFWNNIQSGSAPRDGFLRLLKVSCCIRNVLADNGSRICFFLNKLQKKKEKKLVRRIFEQLAVSVCLQLFRQTGEIFCSAIFRNASQKKKKKNYTSEFSIWLDVWQIFVFLEWKTKRPAASSKTGWGGEKKYEVQLRNRLKIKKKKKKKIRFCSSPHMSI